MSKLSRAERNEIIMNESRGIHHPEYYVSTTKSGQVQVRKRKVPINRIEQPPPQEVINTPPQQQYVQPVPTPTPPQREDVYETMSNKAILEKMLNILEKQSISNDKTLTPSENEHITEENREFIENIRESIPEPELEPEPEPKPEPKPEHIHYDQQVTVKRSLINCRPRKLVL